MRALKIIIASLTLTIVFLLIWGGAIEPRFLIETNTFQFTLPNLPAQWRGKKVAFIADFQFGMWLGNKEMSRKIIAKIVDEKPDLVLLGGDFIYHPVEDDSENEASEEFDEDEHEEVSSLIEEATQIFAPLINAGIPTFAVLGNHDYGMEKQRVLKLSKVAALLRKRLEAVGVKVLHNDSVKLGDEFYLVGIGPGFPEEDDVTKGLQRVPEGASRLVFMHNPQSFKKLPEGSAPLSIAAHTHGGQIRVPFTPHTSWMNFMRPYEIAADGWVTKFDSTKNQLYINRGIGFSKFPIRINCRPELTYFILK